MSKGNTLVAELDAQGRESDNIKGGKIERLFGDQPDVLDAIIRARKERFVSFKTIAASLSKDGEHVGGDAVQSWLSTKGIS